MGDDRALPASLWKSLMEAPVMGRAAVQVLSSTFTIG